MDERADGSLIDMIYMIVGGMFGVLTSMKTHESMIRWFQQKNPEFGTKTGATTQNSAGLSPANTSEFKQEREF